MGKFQKRYFTTDDVNDGGDYNGSARSSKKVKVENDHQNDIVKGQKVANDYQNGREITNDHRKDQKVTNDHQKDQKVTTMTSNSTLNPDTISYLTSLAEHLSQGGTGAMASSVLADRCIEECENVDTISLLLCERIAEAFEYICSKSKRLSSHFLEKLLKLKRKQIKMVFERNFSARTFETILYKTMDPVETISDDTTNDNDNVDNLPVNNTTLSSSLLDEVIEKVCAVLLEELDSLCTEYGGSHVIRCVCRVLCGLDKNHVTNFINGDNNGENRKRPKLKPEFKAHFTNFSNFILDWQYISGYLTSEPVSLLVQEFIELDAKHVKTGNLAKFMDGCLEHDQKMILYQICDKQASRVYERALANCDESRAERFAQVHLKSHLRTLAEDRFGNFVVQRALDRCDTEEMLNDLFEELLPCFDTFWAQKKFGVIVSMVRAAAQSKCKQKKLKKLIFITIGCQDEQRTKFCVPLLLQLKNFDQLDFDVKNPMPDTANVPIHGSLLVQNLLKFKHVEDIVDSFTNLNGTALINVICNSAASRVIDAFFSTSDISWDLKQRLLNKIKPNLHKIACDRVGSRVLECILKHTKREQFIELIQALIRKETALKNSQCGKIIMSKYELQLFKRNRKQWNAKFDEKRD